jgi:hypothetical protein
VHPHPRVLPQRPRQLPVADVDGDHLCGAAAEQDVGEAPGRRSGVEAPAVRDAETGRFEGVESPGQLVAASRDEVRPARIVHDHQRGVCRDSGGRLGGDSTGDLDPARRDQLSRVLARPGQPAADQLGVQAESSGHGGTG